MKPVDEARTVALEVAQQLQQAGHEALFAGGCVRDVLLGQSPKDYDIATSARPEQVLALFPKSESIGVHFGVVLVKMRGHAVEVATFRTDGSYLDGRRPESVEYSTADQDAARRDFTINGLFENPSTGEVIDHVGGTADLKEGILRAIGDPKQRFEEDALRLMRAIRFAVRTGFRIEQNTWKAIQEMAPSLQRIAIERVREEWNAILRLPDRARGLDLLVESGLMAQFLPEVLELIGCEQPPEYHPEGDVYVHTRLMLSLLRPEPELELLLGVVFHDIGKPATRSIDETGRIRFNGHDQVGAEMAQVILTRMKYSSAMIERVCHLVARHMQFMHVTQMRRSKLRRFMSAECFDLEMELHRVDCASSNGILENYTYLQQEMQKMVEEPIIPEPLLRGADLIARGMLPGPAFKKILESVQTEQLEGNLQTREDALKWLDSQ